LSEKDNRMLVRKIKNGTVIDHIYAGRALHVLEILRITGEEGNIVTLAMNIDSKLMGKKDIVKIEDRELNHNEVAKIALLAPRATINIVKNYEVTEKHRIELPKIIHGVIKCTNPRCITNKEREPVTPKFIVTNDNPIELQCYYCDHEINEQDIIKQFRERDTVWS